MLDQIVSIEPVGIMNTIDISLDEDKTRYFYANDILTHNSGQNSSDVTLEDVSESHGTNQTADLIFAMIRTQVLRDSNQILFKQLKNRFADVGYYEKFVVGVDLSRMTMYESSNQELAGGKQNDDQPVFDKSKSGEGFKLDFGDNSGGFTFG